MHVTYFEYLTYVFFLISPSKFDKTHPDSYFKQEPIKYNKNKIKCICKLDMFITKFICAQNQDLKIVIVLLKEGINMTKREMAGLIPPPHQKKKLNAERIKVVPN